MIDLLRSEALRSQIDVLDAPSRTELARLLPELLESPGAAERNPAGGPGQRHRLLDAVHRAVVAGKRPLLLIVDDLQWSDVETLETLGFVVLRSATAPVLIIGTVRSEEIPRDHPLVALTHSLERTDGVTSLPLERLDEVTTARLAARLQARDEIDRELASRLWSETEGNPLFVIEAVRAGIPSDQGERIITPTMRAVLRARLAPLTAGARRVAEVAAIIGRPFSTDLLVAATALDEQELVGHVDELWHRRILVDQDHQYDFSHDKLRAVTLEMTSPARRRRIHRAVAAALVDVHPDDTESSSSQLAAHYDQAGMVEPAIGAYQRAGDRAVAVSALEEAIAMFRRALSLLAELPASPVRDALELDLRIALGSPLVAVEGYGAAEVHQLYERARALCRRLGRPVDAPILRGLGLARLQGCRIDDCSELARALLEHESEDPIARTEGRYLLGVSAFWRGDLGVARQHLEGAIEAYDDRHRAEHLALYAQDPRAVCLVRLAWVDLWAGDAGSAERTARAALDAAAEIDHPMTSAYVITYAAIVVAEAGDLARLAELLESADRAWKRFPEPYLNVVLEALRGWLEVSRGSPAGIETIVRSVTASRTEGETLHLTYTLLLLARARAVVGELREGRAATQEALARSRASNQGYLEAELCRVDGELAFRQGDGEAIDSLRTAVEVAARQGARWLELKALHSTVNRLSDRQSRERLEELLATLPSGHDLPAFRKAAEFLSSQA